MPEPTFSHLLWEYLEVTISYWWLIVPGVLMPLPDLWKHFHPQGKELAIPRWLCWTIALSCLTLAQFLAYRNGALNLARVIEEKKQFSIKTNELTAQLQEEKQKNANVKPFKEPSDSLRRRTVKLADELYEYLRKRTEDHPPFAYPDSRDPNPSEERKKMIQACQKYDQDTLDYYLKHFKDRMVGIVREYQAKGVPTRYLENDFKQRVPGVAAIGSDWEGSSIDELSQFRDARPENPSTCDE